LALRTNYELGSDLNLTAISAYEKLNRNTLVDADGLAVNNFSAGNQGYIKSFSQEVRLAGKYGKDVSWIVGPITRTTPLMTPFPSGCQLELSFQGGDGHGP
jgi:hypothetical protein